MTNTTNNNKAFWVFPNMKESVDSLPPRLRGQAWELIINYAFGDDNCERNCKNNRVSFVFRALKPLIRLRGIAGSQNGKSNNPSGLSKDKQPNIGPNIAPNIGPNPLITETETITETKTKNKEIIKETNMKYGELGNVLLTENQYKHLVESINNVDKAIEELDTWLSKDSVNSKKYIGKNHYGFFKSNSWVWDRVGGYSKRTNIDMASEDYHQQLLKEARPSDEVVFIDGIWQILPF